jgi:hypothetical protein
MAVPYPQGAVDPGLLRSAAVVDLGFDAVAVRRPARRRRERVWDHRSDLVGADDRRAFARV